MATIYIDGDFKCYTAPAEGRTATETSCFDGKCAAFIEGYRFVPAGQSWAREDGVVFQGETAAPFKDSAVLEAAQKVYDELAAWQARQDADTAYLAMMTEVELDG